MLEAGGVELYVSDNGIGVESWRLGKVFDLLDSESGNEDNPGSGIGLALVKRSVLTLGGSVKMQANEAGGSEFRLFFPQQTKNRMSNRSFTVLNLAEALRVLNVFWEMVDFPDQDNH